MFILIDHIGVRYSLYYYVLFVLLLSRVDNVVSTFNTLVDGSALLLSKPLGNSKLTFKCIQVI